MPRSEADRGTSYTTEDYAPLNAFISRDEDKKP